MPSFELVVILLFIVTIVAFISRFSRIELPILLVLAGMGIALLPGVPRIQLDPHLVLLVFLPPILFYNAWFSSWRELKDNLRIMILLTVGLVVATTLLVGYGTHSIIPELPLAAAFVLGAIVSPPDSVAAAVIFKKLPVPRRIITILEGESLLNDATALVAYSIALQTVYTGRFVAEDAIPYFLWVAFGGILWGGISGWILGRIVRYIHEPAVTISFSLLIPFAVYIPAEALHVSGVLAVVTAGLYLGWRSPQIISSTTRLQGGHVWQTLMFLINGFIFLMVGLQFPFVLKALHTYRAIELFSYAVWVSALVIVIRLLWVYIFAYLPRWLSLSLRARDPYPEWQNVFIIAWSGMRGVVSLAAAFAIPLTFRGGILFPERDLILFLTFSVILSTLVLQGVSLPWIIRLLKITDTQKHTCDEMEARYQMATAGLERLNQWIARERIDAEHPWVEHAKSRYTQVIQTVKQANENGSQSSWSPHLARSIQEIKNDLIKAERKHLVHLRERREVPEELMQKLLHELDIEEYRQAHRT